VSLFTFFNWFELFEALVFLALFNSFLSGFRTVCQSFTFSLCMNLFSEFRTVSQLYLILAPLISLLYRSFSCLLCATRYIYLCLEWALLYSIILILIFLQFVPLQMILMQVGFCFDIKSILFSKILEFFGSFGRILFSKNPKSIDFY
jgi:hypothetical protein